MGGSLIYPMILKDSIKSPWSTIELLFGAEGAKIWENGKNERFLAPQVPQILKIKAVLVEIRPFREN